MATPELVAMADLVEILAAGHALADRQASTWWWCWPVAMPSLVAIADLVEILAGGHALADRQASTWWWCWPVACPSWSPGTDLAVPLTLVSDYF